MAKSIASPIKTMTDAMSRLAKREMTAEIVGRGRKDEVGAMANGGDAIRTASRLAWRLSVEDAAGMARIRRIEPLRVVIMPPLAASQWSEDWNDQSTPMALLKAGVQLVSYGPGSGMLLS